MLEDSSHWVSPLEGFFGGHSEESYAGRDAVAAFVVEETCCHLVAISRIQRRLLIIATSDFLDVKGRYRLWKRVVHDVVGS